MPHTMTLKPSAKNALPHGTRSLRNALTRLVVDGAEDLKPHKIGVRECPLRKEFDRTGCDALPHTR